MPYKAKSRVTEFLTVEEFNMLLHQADTEEHYLLLRSLWETGGRSGEVCRLKPESIDVHNNCLLLPNFKQHKETHPLKRVYLFTDSDLIFRLKDYCQRNHIKEGEWIFPGRRSTNKPMNQLYVWRLVTKYAKACGIRHIKKDPHTGEDANRPAWPHTFRHGMGYYLLNRTGRLDVVRDQLGHSSVQTTEIYATLTNEDRKHIIQGDKQNV